MIDIANAKWDLSKEEQYAIKWLNENGFDVKLERQYVSKTVFTVSKDGVTDSFEISQGLTPKNAKAYMEQYHKNWETLVELHQLRALAGTN